MQLLRRQSAVRLALGLWIAAALVLAACGDGDDEQATVTRGEQTRAVRGDSLIQGPITEAEAPAIDPYADTNACLSCHEGIEIIRCSDTQMFQEIIMVAEASGTNNQCVVCHGGDAEVTRPADVEKGSQAYESDGCYAPDLGSVDHLGSISQCSHGKGSSYSNYEVGSGGSGKGGKGNYEYYCPPEWDPLNNQFTCQMKPECDVVVN